MKLRIVRLTVLCFFAACLLGAGTIPAPVSSSSAAVDWPLTGGTAFEQRYSQLTKINRTNAGHLGMAWAFSDFVVRGRTHRGVEATPVMVDGVLYFSGPWSVVYAIDAKILQKISRHSATLSRTTKLHPIAASLIFYGRGARVRVHCQTIQLR